MTELLIGIETEYALVALSPRDERIEQDDLMQRLMDRAVSVWPHLPARSETGIFLPNGGRLYVDTGGHLEFSTPECSTPAEVVRHVGAGDQIVLALARDIAAHDPDIGEMAVLRTNVDYASGSTWGCHESYLHTVSSDALSAQLLPLLSSRVVFGAGGLDVRSAGVRFVLSPRAAFIECERSASSAIARGLLHVKDEPLAGHGYRRLHLICGESLSSEFGTYLKVGSTALAVAMIEAGLQPAEGIELADPIGALARYNGDPSLRARAARERRPGAPGPRRAAPVPGPGRGSGGTLLHAVVGGRLLRPLARRPGRARTGPAAPRAGPGLAGEADAVRGPRGARRHPVARAPAMEPARAHEGRPAGAR